MGGNYQQSFYPPNYRRRLQIGIQKPPTPEDFSYQFAEGPREMTGPAGSDFDMGK